MMRQRNQSVPEATVYTIRVFVDFYLTKVIDSNNAKQCRKPVQRATVDTRVKHKKYI